MRSQIKPQSKPLTFVHGTTVIQSSPPALRPLLPKPASEQSQSMASETSLNQLVKGAPTEPIKPPTPAPLPHLSASSADKFASEPALAVLPSSPPQIYLNLLIHESSLRSQYLHLLLRRRLNTFFLLLLTLWEAFFFYALFLRPREDGVGLGGSVYWVVETSEKLALMGGTVTVLFVWATGQWERGIRWPRRWLGTTNRGLRVFNLRVVVIKRKFWREMLGHFSFLLPYGLWRDAGGSDWHLVEHENGTIVEEDLAKGGDHIMLLLLPKSFSPEFRENWEEYRNEYWEKENDRRANLRRKLMVQRRHKAQEAGGWKWWTGAWRLTHHRTRRQHDLEKHAHGHHPHHHQHPHNSPRSGLSEKDAAALKASRRRSLLRSDSAHSRQSSRSSTPQGDFDGISEKTLTAERVRRGSSVSSTASVRRKMKDRRDGVSSLAMTGISSDSVGGDEKPKKKRDRDRDRDREKDRDRDGVSGSDRLGAPA